jgi:hypothetical protein
MFTFIPKVIVPFALLVDWLIHENNTSVHLFHELRLLAEIKEVDHVSVLLRPKARLDAAGRPPERSSNDTQARTEH